MPERMREKLSHGSSGRGAFGGSPEDDELFLPAESDADPNVSSAEQDSGEGAEDRL